ncbi:MAG: alpha/beta fold hydrolase [Betaproteobacteria bacterium]|nr:alpha/beta fold hydrolase [Betaproteobacteria bacterium]
MREVTFCFGKGAQMVGTLCLPDPAPTPGRPGLVLFNAGVIGRIGPHRLNVHLARRVAASGIPVMRFDLRGVGDSNRPAGDASFESQAIADVREAMDAFAEQTGSSRFLLFGFCSGAYYSFGTALVDTRVSGLILYDAFRYPTARAIWNKHMASIRRQGLLRAVWRRLARAVREAVKGGSGDDEPVANVAYITQMPTRREFADQANQLASRGIRLHMIFSGGLESYNYAEQFNDAFRGEAFLARTDSRHFPDWDHVATRLEHHRQLVDTLTAIVGRELAD